MLCSVCRWRNQILPMLRLRRGYRLFTRNTYSTMLRTSRVVGEGDAGGDLRKPRRSYQVVVAATRDMGIGKDGKLPWRLPQELKFFKELTSAVAEPGRKKKNAVLMGRKTWESIPQQFRPLPGRLNVVLTRSGIAGTDIGYGDDVLLCGSLSSALELLSASRYCSAVENIFVIGGGEILREALNAQQCDAIHITEIETEVECDTFIPMIDLTIFKQWYSSSPVVENDIRYSFTTYVRVRNSPSLDPNCVTDKFCSRSFSFLPMMIFERHEEFAFLNLVREVLSGGTRKVDRNETQMRFNLRKSFPLLTTKRLCWERIAEELLKLVSGLNNGKVFRDGLDDVINKIISGSDDQRIILPSYSLLSDGKSMSPEAPSHPIVAQFHVSNGELSCRTYQESADVALDCPYSIASCALMTCCIAQLCGLHPGDLIQAIGNAYVTDSHVVPLKEQLESSPRPFPSLKIGGERNDIGSFTAADFELTDYHPIT